MKPRRRTIRSKPTRIALRDNEGNVLLCIHSKTRVRLYLTLSGKRWKRDIGYIDRKSKTLHVLRDRNKHLHWKTNSYGFNHTVLNKTQLFDKVLLKDQEATFRIPKDEILAKGRYLYFSEQGFERQVFLPLSALEPYKVKTRKPQTDAAA